MIHSVKGMRDILPPASALWNEVEAAARRIFTRFHYREIRTPILEETALFASIRAVNSLRWLRK